MSVIFAIRWPIQKNDVIFYFLFFFLIEIILLPSFIHKLEFQFWPKKRR